MMMDQEQEADPNRPPWLHLFSAFLAMEPSHSLLSLSRECGGGTITETVQNFILEHCISQSEGKGHAPYIKSFLKKLILEIESVNAVVVDQLYEQFSFYMASLKDGNLANRDSGIIRKVSFLQPTGKRCSSIRSSKKETRIYKLEKKNHLGSGVGLVGICLTHVKPSKVTLSDGDLSTLANLKLNLELNHRSTRFGSSESIVEDPCKVECLHLPWESALESDLRDLKPDIVLGADVIYDPQCISHLVRVITTFLTTKMSNHSHREETKGLIVPNGRVNGDILNNKYEEFVLASRTQVHNPLHILLLLLGISTLMIIFLWLRNRRIL